MFVFEIAVTGSIGINSQTQKKDGCDNTICVILLISTQILYGFSILHSFAFFQYKYKTKSTSENNKNNYKYLLKRYFNKKTWFRSPWINQSRKLPKVTHFV
jgi:hypothetical protein